MFDAFTKQDFENVSAKKDEIAKVIAEVFAGPDLSLDLAIKSIELYKEVLDMAAEILKSQKTES